MSPPKRTLSPCNYCVKKLGVLTMKSYGPPPAVLNTGSALDGPAPREVSFVGYHITSRGRSVGTPKVGVDSPKAVPECRWLPTPL